MIMGKVDLRKLEEEEKQDLKVEVLSAVNRWGNISAVADRYGIHRQVIYKWLKDARNPQPKGQKRGRTAMIVIYPSQEVTLLRRLSEARPSEVGASGTLWTTSSLKTLITGVVREYTEYLVRKILRRWGFVLNDRRKGLFYSSHLQTGSVSPVQFAHQTGRRCFLIETVREKVSGNQYTFPTVFSPRGDVYFMSSQWSIQGDRLMWLINLLERQTHKKLLVLYNSSDFYGSCVPENEKVLPIRV